MLEVKEARKILGDGKTIFTNSAPRNRKKYATAQSSTLSHPVLSTTKSNHRDSIDRSRGSDSVEAVEIDLISQALINGHKDDNSDIKRAPRKV